jgi:hypothetical protein
MSFGFKGLAVINGMRFIIGAVDMSDQKCV